MRRIRKRRMKDQRSGIEPAPSHAFAPRPRSEWIFPTSFSKLTGFVSYSSQPAANAFSRLFSEVSEVTTLIGMCFVSGWPFRRRVASQPSSPGSLRSITIRSGRSVFAQSTPSAPFIATLTSNPARAKRLCSENRLSSLSSTQRILVIAAFSFRKCSAHDGCPKQSAATRRVSLRLKEDKDARSGSDGRVLGFFTVSPAAPHHGDAVRAAAHALFEIGRKDSAERVDRHGGACSNLPESFPAERDCIRVRRCRAHRPQHDEVDS